MIHTMQLYTMISFEEKISIENRFNKDIENIMKDISKDIKGINIGIKSRALDYQITLFADVTKILGRGEIYENDYYIIQKEIDQVIEQIVGYTLELTLLRIEYRFDKLIESNSEREILIYLYKKLIDKHGFKKKKNKKEYKTSIRYDSGSKILIIYDKEKERIDKGKDIESYEKNILRFEVKLLNNHLNYNRHKYDIEKTLKNYFSLELQNEYMLSNIQTIVYKGDYYNLYHAKKVIDKSDLSGLDKKLLIEFLIDVSKNGITGAKSIKLEDEKLKYTLYKYKKCINLLELLNINPILIPKNKKASNGDSYSYIKNPFDI